MSDKKARGRGPAREEDVEKRYEGRSNIFDRLGGKEGGSKQAEEAPRKSRTDTRPERDGTPQGAIKSVEGWIIFIRNLHEEATEDDVIDKFAAFGPVKNIQMPLNRQSGFVKGYALVEYDKREEAEQAIKDLNGATFLEQKISVSWAFSKDN